MAPMPPSKILPLRIPQPPHLDESVGREGFRALDRMSEAIIAPWTGGVSPAALALAAFDWSIHLAVAPGKRMELLEKVNRKTLRWLAYVMASCVAKDTPPCIEPLPGDPRFDAPAWRKQPYTLFGRRFCLASNGGITSPTRSPASLRITRMSSPSLRVRCWTCFRPRIIHC